MKILSLVVAVPLLFFPLRLDATGESPGVFRFADPIVRIPSGAQSGTGQIVLQSTSDQTAAPTIRDVALPQPFAAAVKFDLFRDQSESKNRWQFAVTVTGLSPANTVQPHYATVQYADKKEETIPYFVSNQPLGSFAWTISKPPDPWVYSDWLPNAGCTSLIVTAKDSPATGLVISSANLIEQTTKQAITARDLRLCRDERCTAQGSIDLAANVPTPLLLCLARSFHGNYHGNVAVACLQKPDGEPILQNIDTSSFLLKSVGVLAIGLGVCLAWWGKIWARARLERDQALMAAVVMRTQLRALEEVLRELRAPYRTTVANLLAAIKALLEELEDSVLDQRKFVPPKFPNPYGYSVDAAAYKAYLEDRNPKIQLLSTLIRQGVVPAEAEDNGTLTAAQQAQVHAAISDIDRMSIRVPVPTADQALLQVQGLLTNLHLTLYPPAPGAPPQAPAVPVSPMREYEVLSLEMQSISKGIWLLYGVLTALSGLVFLILSNPGYGVSVDLVFAFFWGFGLPTTIGALTPGSAATSLNIPIARS